MEATRITRKPGAKKEAMEAARVTRPPAPAEIREAATRITRPRGRRSPSIPSEPSRKAPLEEAARAPTPSPEQAAAPVARTPPALLPLARFALVALVFGRERAAELLDGLGAREAARAKEHLAHFSALSSAERQARVAVEFGMRSDPADQLRALMVEAPEALRREIFRRLPPYHRSLFPKRRVEPPDASAIPALCALAERLIREATR
jgi:hypothetical protein